MAQTKTVSKPATKHWCRPASSLSTAALHLLHSELTIVATPRANTYPRKRLPPA